MTEEKTNMGVEVWKRLKFEGLKDDEIYEISNHGRLRHWYPKLNDFKIMKQSTVRGYKYFMWFKSNEGWDNKIKKIIHRLVAEAFCEKVDEDYDFVIHLDHDKANNYYKNLKWVTRMQMTEHNQTNPRVMAAHAARKGRINNSKLTEADVLRLKKKIKRGKVRLYQLAKEFGITHTQLNRIRKGQNWAHVKLEDED